MSCSSLGSPAAPAQCTARSVLSLQWRAHSSICDESVLFRRRDNSREREREREKVKRREWEGSEGKGGRKEEGQEGGMEEERREAGRDREGGTN